MTAHRALTEVLDPFESWALWQLDESLDLSPEKGKTAINLEVPCEPPPGSWGVGNRPVHGVGTPDWKFGWLLPQKLLPEKTSQGE